MMSIALITGAMYYYCIALAIRAGLRIYYKALLGITDQLNKE
jgi:hypothetical protein